MPPETRKLTSRQRFRSIYRNTWNRVKNSLPGVFLRKLYYGARFFSNASLGELRALQKVEPRTRNSLVTQIPLWMKIDENRWAEQENPHIEHLLHAFRKGELASVGGDTSDLLQLDPRHALFTLMDMAGKGPPANEARANFQSYLRGALDIFHRHYVQDGTLDSSFTPNVLDEWMLSLAKDMEDLHRQHFSDEKHEVNIFGQGLMGYFKVHPQGRHVDFHYVPFGHLPFIVMKKQDDGSYEKEIVEPKGSVFNFPDRELLPIGDVQRLRLKAGDKLIVYTDGLTEAHKPSGEMFEERMHELVEKNAHLSPEELADLIKEERKKFILGRPASGWKQRLSKAFRLFVGKPLPEEDDLRLRIFEVAPGVTESYPDPKKKQTKAP